MIIGCDHSPLCHLIRQLLGSHIKTCVADGIRQGDDEVVDELVNMLQKLLK